jgi:DNA-binding NarL/FixJ family response regulator
VRVSIGVVLAEDNSLLRHGLVRLIGAADDIALLGSAADLPGLESLIEQHAPDVVVTDIRMPPTHSDEGIAVAARLRTERPTTGVLLLSQYAEATYALTLLSDGTARRGYLLKERVADVTELVTALRTVAAGGSVVDPKVVEALVQGRARRGDADLERLSAREREVLGQMALGHNNAAIAESLFITQRAVEKHINSIFSKLTLTEETEVHRRVKAVLLFLSDT